VNDLLSLVQILAISTLVVAPAIVINRLLDRSEGGTLADLFAIPLDAPWPRGVQEEEPARWRVENLHPSRRAIPQGDRARSRQPAQPAPLGTGIGRCG
jgi:hypothetical protein